MQLEDADFALLSLAVAVVHKDRHPDMKGMASESIDIDSDVPLKAGG